jgi:hypothetical protein
MTRDDALHRVETELRAAMREVAWAASNQRRIYTRVKQAKALLSKRDRIASLPPDAECDERGYQLVSSPASTKL